MARREKIQEAVMTLYRPRVCPLCGLSCKVLIDTEVFILMGTLSPEQALCHEGTRTSFSVADLVDAYLFGILVEEGSCIKLIIGDWVRVGNFNRTTGGRNDDISSQEADVLCQWVSGNKAGLLAHVTRAVRSHLTASSNKVRYRAGPNA